MQSDLENHLDPKVNGPFDRMLATLESGLGALAALFILALMIIGVGQIVFRLIWSYPIPGYIDIVELMMAVVAFAAVAEAERLRAHIRMDFLPTSMPDRWRPVYEAFVAFIALLAVTSLVYATWFSFQRSWTLGETTMDIGAPIWPSKLLLVTALSMLWLRLAFSVIGYLRLWRGIPR